RPLTSGTSNMTGVSSSTANQASRYAVSRFGLTQSAEPIGLYFMAVVGEPGRSAIHVFLPDHQHSAEKIDVGIGDCFFVRLGYRLRANAVDPRQRSNHNQCKAQQKDRKLLH